MGGRARVFDELFGAAATPGDRWRALAVASFGAAAAAALTIGAQSDIRPIALLVVAVVAFDLFGGLWSNAIAGVWTGRPRSLLWRILFVSLHPHAFVLAWAISAYDVLDAAGTWAWAIAGSAIVIALPSPHRLAAALILCALGIGVLDVLDGHAATSWAPAAYLLKLLVAFAARPDSSS